MLSAEPGEITPSSLLPVWAAPQWHMVLISHAPHQARAQPLFYCTDGKATTQRGSACSRSHSRVVARVETEMKLGLQPASQTPCRQPSGLRNLWSLHCNQVFGLEIS